MFQNIPSVVDEGLSLQLVPPSVLPESDRKVHNGLRTQWFKDTLCNGWICMVMPTVHRGMIKENILIVKENISDDSMTRCSTITTDWSGFCCNLM